VILAGLAAVSLVACGGLASTDTRLSDAAPANARDVTVPDSPSAVAESGQRVDGPIEAGLPDDAAPQASPCGPCADGDAASAVYCAAADGGPSHCAMCQDFEQYSICIDARWLVCRSFGSWCREAGAPAPPEGTPCCPEDFISYPTGGDVCHCVGGRGVECTAFTGYRVAYTDHVCPALDASISDAPSDAGVGD
jgi:hypothetical protein